MTPRAIPKACVIGHPIAHSRSPLIHRHWLETLAIDGAYDRIDVPPERLDEFFARMRCGEFIGCNITLPHKQAAISLVDCLEPQARQIGAINTVYRRGNRLVGASTDGYGFIASLRQSQPGVCLDQGHIVLIGAGGAARSLIPALLTLKPKTVAVANRSHDKAQALADHFGDPVSAHDLDTLPSLLARCDLLVNATSLGMSGQPDLAIPLNTLKSSAVVADIVYSPLMTSLLTAARARGHPIVDGLGMLMHQAVPGFAHWFGARPQVTQQLRRLLEADLAGHAQS